MTQRGPLVRFDGLREIATALNARGVATARGGQWYAKSVANVLERADAAAGEDGGFLGQRVLSSVYFPARPPEFSLCTYEQFHH